MGGILPIELAKAPTKKASRGLRFWLTRPVGDFLLEYTTTFRNSWKKARVMEGLMERRAEVPKPRKSRSVKLTNSSQDNRDSNTPFQNPFKPSSS
jgi:hypothetical protein